MTNWGWARNAGKYAGPIANTAFGVLDYADGKAQGEDDIRATAGAIGSTVGGIGGVAAGAATGAAIGSVIPGAGTAIGGLVGGAIGLGSTLIGGYLGNQVGGWTADRTDELIRGNKGVNNNNNMATFNQGMTDEYGRPIGQQKQQGWGMDDSNWGFLDTIATGTVLGTGAVAARNGLHGNNPINQYQLARQTGIPRRVAVPAVAKQAAQNIGRGFQNLPLGGKYALASAALYGANEVLGKPVQGFLDFVTGNNFDFDGKGKPAPSNTANSQRDQRMVNEAYGIPNYDMPLTPQKMAKINADREDYTYRRNFNDTRDVNREGDERYRRRRAMEIRADQARDLTVAFSQSIPNAVANQIQTIFAGGMVK